MRGLANRALDNDHLAGGIVLAIQGDGRQLIAIRLDRGLDRIVFSVILAGVALPGFSQNRDAFLHTQNRRVMTNGNLKGLSEAVVNHPCRRGRGRNDLHGHLAIRGHIRLISVLHIGIGLCAERTVGAAGDHVRLTNRNRRCFHRAFGRSGYAALLFRRLS